MRRINKLFKATISFARTHRSLFWRSLLLGIGPVLIIALVMNLYFFQTRLKMSSETMYSVTSQNSKQIEQLYTMAFSLMQNARLHTTLQDDVLSTYGQPNDNITLNRNFIKLHSLINAYTLYDNLLKVRFYLPGSLVIPNENSIISIETTQKETWYENYSYSGNIRRWYISSKTPGSHYPDVFCTVTPIQDPFNYSKTIGFLRVDIDISKIISIISESSALDDVSFFLVDSEQGLLWKYGELTEDLLRSELLGQVNSGSYYTTMTLNQNRYWISIHPISTSSMSFIYITPLSNMTKNIFAGCLVQILLMLFEMIILIIIGVLFVGAFVSSRNNQLKLLNVQINPHFLYNTLDLINWHAIEQNLPQIYRPVQSLSKYYKLTLNRGEDLIYIVEEMEHVRLYIDLQNMRFRGGITYRIEVEPNIQHYSMLHMVLQPIVENAIVHGIREKELQTGHIQITASCKENKLFFTVTDDGIGMDSVVVRQLLNDDSSIGYGLSNIQQRIQLVYGHKYGLHIISAIGKGTTIQITMPLIKKHK